MNGRRAWLALLPAVVLVALGSGGCSMSYQLNSLFERKSSGEPASEITGSIGGAPASHQTIPEADSALRAAASELLGRNEDSTSLPWENAQTGARGTVTPIAAAYTQAGRTCRDFLASYIREGSEAWLQGEACRSEEGHWEVRSLKPWTRS
jgi:surface antigen